MESSSSFSGMESNSVPTYGGDDSNRTADEGDPMLNADDWRRQFQAGTRQRVVNKILETLKRHLPFSGEERLKELMRFEENIFATAATKSDYVLKILHTMHTLEANFSQNPLPNPLASNPALNNNTFPDPGVLDIMKERSLCNRHKDPLLEQLMKQKVELVNLKQTLLQLQAQQQNLLRPTQQQPSKQSASLDQSVETGHANGAEWREELYQRIETAKETYLPQLNQACQNVATKLEQLDSLPQQQKSDELDKLKRFKTLLERIISFLQVSKSNILPSYKDKLDSYEKKILHLIPVRPRNPSPPQKQGQVPHCQTEAMPQQQSQISQVIATKTEPQNPLPNPLASNFVGDNKKFPEPGASLASTAAQSGHSNGDDWKEEAYQKIKTMRETYLPELNQMLQEIVTKLQQLDSLPRRPRSDLVDKLKLYKTMLERMVSFLQVSKTNILPGHKEKLGLYERQIINFFNRQEPV